jgi:hypothetical protein
MNDTYLLVWWVALVILVVLGGALVQRSLSRPYFAFYLVVVVAVSIAIPAVIDSVSPEGGQFSGGWMMVLTAPVMIGGLVLLLGRAGDLLGLPRPLLWAAGMLALLAVVLGFYQFFDRVVFYGFGLVALALVFGLRRAGLLPLGLLTVGAVLYGMLVQSNLLDEIGRQIGPVFGLPVVVLFFLVPGVLAAASAAWLAVVLDGEAAIQRVRIASLAVAVFSVGYLVYSIYWASIWDQTSDGFTAPIWQGAASVTVLAAGMMLGLRLSGWRRVAGVAFTAAAALLIFQALGWGWQTSYHTLTEQRAARIEQALTRYYDQQGRYPEALKELAPRYLLAVPQPVILQRVGWCYQGGANHYRLGTFYREYFSLPTEFRLYAEAGQAPAPWACEEQAEFVESNYPSPSPWRFAEQPQGTPDPEPLPTDSPVELVAAGDVSRGSWSPDGSKLLFSQPDGSDGTQQELYLYDAARGEICPTGEEYSFSTGWLPDQHAWLADERLLYTDAGGRVLILEPCQPGGIDLSHLFGESPGEPPLELRDAIQILMAFDPRSGRALIQYNDRFWILDPVVQTVLPVEDIQPNPYDLHWDQAAFSPQAGRLAIARLNGREGQDGSTLYVLDPETGEIQLELAREQKTGQSAGQPEWLNEHTILLHGQGNLALLDLSREPLAEVSVLRDLFGLDLDYPDQVGSMTWLRREDGSFVLAVWVNHPRNQGIYLYDSAEEAVQTLHPERDVFLMFSGVEWIRLGQLENSQAGRDEQWVYRLDQPGQEPVRLNVEGHTQRSYSHLSALLLPEWSLAALASSQGVSLHDIRTGEQVAFYNLPAGGLPSSPWLTAVPDGSELLAVVSEVGLFRIPLE